MAAFAWTGIKINRGLFLCAAQGVSTAFRSTNGATRLSLAAVGVVTRVFWWLVRFILNIVSYLLFGRRFTA